MLRKPTRVTVINKLKEIKDYTPSLDFDIMRIIGKAPCDAKVVHDPEQYSWFTSREWDERDLDDRFEEDKPVHRIVYPYTASLDMSEYMLEDGWEWAHMEKSNGKWIVAIQRGDEHLSTSGYHLPAVRMAAVLLSQEKN